MRQPVVRSRLKAIFGLLDGKAIDAGELTRRVYGTDDRANRNALRMAIRAWRLYEPGVCIESTYHYRVRQT